MTKKILISGFVAAALAIPAFAFVGAKSGLKAGENVTPFHPNHITGPLAGTTNCWPCTFQARPQVQIWLNEDSAKNIETFAKTLDKAMTDHKGQEFKALLVFVTSPDHVADWSKKVKAIEEKTKVKSIGMAVIGTDNEAIGNYKVNTDASVKNTVFVYKNWKVEDSMVNLTADKDGLKRLNAAIDKVSAK